MSIYIHAFSRHLIQHGTPVCFWVVFCFDLL